MMGYDFEIVEYSPRVFREAPDTVAAKVELRFAKEIAENYDVGEFVRVGVMVKCPADATRADLERAVVDAATARLAAALKFVEGRNAADILSKAKLVTYRNPPPDDLPELSLPEG